MLVVDPERHVRALNDGEMQSLADASHGLHLLYTKYSLLMAPASASLPTTSGRNTLKARSANPSDCALISSRLPQCRVFDEIAGWYLWHGYAASTTEQILHRARYHGIMPTVMMTLLMKAEIFLSACLCSFPAARQLLLSRHIRGTATAHGIAYHLPAKIFTLLREGNPLNVPVRAGSTVSDRSVARHYDMPGFFYELPFHYLNSSPLVEAWFAAPSASERRSLIAWPTHADVAKTVRCPVWKLFTVEEIDPCLYRNTGSSSNRTPKATLHPQLELIYDLLSAAIQYDNIRVKWRARYQLQLDKAPSATKRTELRTQLILSLILGDVRDVANYSPPDALLRHSYTYSSAVLDVTCVPVCYQNHRVSTVPGFSLPIRGPPSHAPRRSFFLGVQSQIASYNHAFSVALPAPELEPEARATAMTDAATAVATPPDVATVAAIKAMVGHAEIWARELIESTRDPRGPARHEFPPLACPVVAQPIDSDAQLPIPRPSLFLDDEDEEGGSLPPDAD